MIRRADTSGLFGVFRGSLCRSIAAADSRDEARFAHTVLRWYRSGRAQGTTEAATAAAVVVAAAEAVMVAAARAAAAF